MGRRRGRKIRIGITTKRWRWKRRSGRRTRSKL
jgi:hypothetical protein